MTSRHPAAADAPSPSMSVVVRPAYDIPGFCEAFGVGRSHVFDEIARGRLRATKIGRRTVIAGTDAMAWLEAYRNASDRSAPKVA
ncbi:helix-turn-helix domain-containing protein [Geminicoccus flavidas]|uniref:helix-turn-helix domain-containing protein n=1 Tax=Geminicoccus flavidas TaxID=2506407 RepID=UPI001357C946|nr:helix-turn-helix domain-containing protein [Geminicoccus flavidas]